MSAGEIVNIPSNNIVNLESMQSDMRDTVAFTRDYAEKMQLVFTEALIELQASVGEYSPEKISIDTDKIQLDKPVFPDIPSFESYTSDIRDELISWVSKNVAEGGTGITEAVHTAIVEREKETRRANQDKTYRLALDSVGSRGFNLPTGQIAAVQTLMVSDILKSDQDALNALAIKDFDLAQVNTHFVITSGIDLEKTLVSTWAKIQDTTTAVYNARIQGLAAEYDALSKWVLSEVELIKVEADVAIKNGDLGLEAYKAVASLAEKVASSTASLASQSIASALGAINTTLSNSYSGSEGRSESWSHGESLAESHSYEHDPIV